MKKIIYFDYIHPHIGKFYFYDDDGEKREFKIKKNTLIDKVTIDIDPDDLDYFGLYRHHMYQRYDSVDQVCALLSPSFDITMSSALELGKWIYEK